MAKRKVTRKAASKQPKQQKRKPKPPTLEEARDGADKARELLIELDVVLGSASDQLESLGKIVQDIEGLHLAALTIVLHRFAELASQGVEDVTKAIKYLWLDEEIKRAKLRAQAKRQGRRA